MVSKYVLMRYLHIYGFSNLQILPLGNDQESWGSCKEMEGIERETIWNGHRN